MTNWLPVVGYEGLYSVSDQGQVRSEARTIMRKNGSPFSVTEKMLRLSLDGAGYPTVNLCKGDRGKTFRVHILVLTAFVGPAFGRSGLHANDIKTDNAAENLRWGTQADNNRDIVANGNHYLAKKTHCLRGHEFTAENTYIIPSTGSRRCRQCKKQYDRNGVTA